MDDAYKFAASIGYADQSIEQASKEKIVNALRLIAINVGDYQTRYGQVPQDELLAMVKAETLTDEQMAMVIAGMQNLVSALAEVSGDPGTPVEDAVH